MEQIRSFIAVELPGELRSGLSQLQAQLRSGSWPGVKWVDPHGVHLTLKFLGNIAAARVGEIAGVMAEATEGIPPFNLEVRGLGVFPNLRRVQVVWVGVGGNMDRLKQLQHGIESRLVPLGFAAESRAFTPHLTLARLRDRVSNDERQRFGELIAATKFDSVYSVFVDAISLIRSQLTREGAIYTPVASVGLKKPLSTAMT